MPARREKPFRATVPPPPVLPCVWMSAGLVAFKLCDREGECEGCPFDLAMHGPSRPSRDVVSERPAPSVGAGRRPRGGPRISQRVVPCPSLIHTAGPPS